MPRVLNRKNHCERALAALNHFTSESSTLHASVSPTNKRIFHFPSASRAISHFMPFPFTSHSEEISITLRQLRTSSWPQLCAEPLNSSSTSRHRTQIPFCTATKHTAYVLSIYARQPANGPKSLTSTCSARLFNESKEEGRKEETDKWLPRTCEGLVRFALYLKTRFL